MLPPATGEVGAVGTDVVAGVVGRLADAGAGADGAAAAGVGGGTGGAAATAAGRDLGPAGADVAGAAGGRWALWA
jgi:hypothetical protein